MSQNPIVLPTTGTFSGLQEQDYINNALDTLNTKWSGAGAPSSPEVGQYWLNTNVSPYQLNMWDGSQWVIVGYLNTTAHTWVTNIPENYISGYILSNDSTSPNTVLDIAAGQASDSTNAVSILLASAFTKSTGGSWASGSGNPGMGTGLSIAANTWYHVFAIINAGATDVYFDTSVGAANAPSGTTAFRRIGSFLTNSSAQINRFTQNGSWFSWSAPVDGYSTSSAPTSLTLVTLAGVPTGINVIVNIQGYAGSSTQTLIYVQDYCTTSIGTGATTITTNVAEQGFRLQALSNTSAQVAVVASVSGATVQLGVMGWIDRRGQ